MNQFISSHSITAQLKKRNIMKKGKKNNRFMLYNKPRDIIKPVPASEGDSRLSKKKLFFSDLELQNNSRTPLTTTQLGVMDLYKQFLECKKRGKFFC